MSRRVITFSRNVFLPLTTVCRNRCGYCGFRRPVGPGCVMEAGEVSRILQLGAGAGCTEALFTFGERPGEERGFAPHLPRGYRTIVQYCHDLCRAAAEAGLLPHTNAGILSREELVYLREVNVSMGLMLETTAQVPAHRNSPGKDPERRAEMIALAGELRIPFTTGLLLGIGETMDDREESLLLIRDLHRRYGHIQEVILQNFAPRPGTAMAGAGVIGWEEMARVIRLAREILPDEVAVQIPPNLARARELIPCGVDDLGGISPVTVDYVNPEHPWPQLDSLKDLVGDRRLRERLCIYPRYIEKGWYPPNFDSLIRRLETEIQERWR